MKNIKNRFRSYDNRDIDLLDVIPLLGKGERKMLDISKIFTLYQNGWPSCGAHAGAYKKEIQEIFDSGYIGGFSPRYLWIKIKQIDGFPLMAGTDMRSIFKALSKWGICKYSLLPNKDFFTLGQYSDPSAITKEMDNDAQENIIDPSYGFLKNGFTKENLKSALDTFVSVTLLIQNDDGFFGTQYPTFKEKKYGHFVESFWYNDDYIFVFDSTEKDTTKCIKFIRWEDFSFIREAGTTVDVPNEKIKEMMKQKNLLTRIVELYNIILKLLKNDYTKTY